MKRFILAILPLVFLGSASASEGIQWLPWTPQVFLQAKQQHRPVFLYLEATWCHWCHVMQQTTFEDEGVQRLLSEGYIAVRVDHDADPLLANQYRDYGWPALIFLSADGSDLVKRSGYIEPESFKALLRTILKDPSPELAPQHIQVSGTAQLSPSHRDDLLRRHRNSYDQKLGGLLIDQKYIERDSVEYAIEHASDTEERRRVEITLTAAHALIDPVWGGMYQYSTQADWNHPHYEKIMRTQAGALRIYSLAYRAMQRSEDLEAADRIRDYLFKWLRDRSGAFYVSQDADLNSQQSMADYFSLDNVNRRRLGVPRIDRSIYSDANGMAAEALAMHGLYANRQESLAAAQKAVTWILQNRQGPLGGLRHGNRPQKLEYLSDNLYIARATLSLYRATANQRWLLQAIRLGDHIAKTFDLPMGGLSSASTNALPLSPSPVLEENLSAARFLNLLYAYSGIPQHRRAAESALRWAIGHDNAEPAIEEAGLLLADEEITIEPLHLTVVGSKQDANAKKLYGVASQLPLANLRVEWLDRTERPLPNQTVSYPLISRAAGFSCLSSRCSAPRFTAEDYATAIRALMGRH